MARQRMLRNEVWASQQVDALADFDFRVYMGLISNADDWGRLPANPIILTSWIFPRRGDAELPIRIHAAIVNMEAMRDAKDNSPLVGIYQVGEDAYLFHPKWFDHQTIPVDRRSKSKCPAPPSISNYSKGRTNVSVYGYDLSQTRNV